MFKQLKQRRARQDRCHSIIQRALPLAQMWKLKMDDAVARRDVKRAEHILRHLRRIRRTQLAAEAELKRAW